MQVHHVHNLFQKERLLLWCLVVLMQACTAVAPKQEVELQQDALITQGEAAAITMKKSEMVEVKQKPILVEAPGYISVLILPHLQSPTKTRLSLRRIENWSDEILQKQQSAMLNDLVAKINETQTLLASDRAPQALQLLEQTQQRYPYVGYLKFLTASAYLILGNQPKAKSLLKSALEEFPENKEGQKLYESLAEIPEARPANPAKETDKDNR